MTELQQIESALGRLARWRRWHHAWRGFWRGLFLGAILWLIVLGLYKLLPIPAWSSLAAGMALAVSALIGFISGGWRNPSILETARWVDERKHLEERLSTALEMARSGKVVEWNQLLVHDAASHARDLAPGQLLPLKLPIISHWTLLVLLLSVGLVFVPEYRTQAHIQRQKDAENIQQVGKQLTELLRHTLVEKPPTLPPVRQNLEAASQTADQLTKAPLTRSEALRDLASITEKLAQQAQKLDSQTGLKRLERAAREPGGGEGQTAEGLRKKLEEMKNALGKAGEQPQALDDLKNKLDNLKQKAAGAEGQDGGMSEDSRQQMAEALGALSQQAQSLGASLPGLEEAIEALKTGKTELFLRDMQAAIEDLEQMKQMAKAMQQCQQQVAKMGKDLAEQLEKGQAQAAQSTLDKMIKQLGMGNLSPEALKKMMEEVSQAIQPGSQYGKVGEHLQNAAQNLQKKQNPNAAQNLADAAKELEKLQQQLADSQALRDALDALQRAQSAIAMGKSWEELSSACQACGGKGCARCKGTGRNMSWGQGGKPGMGVGTWADETGWTYFDSENWGKPFDPSGIERPDMDSRGQSDRPDNLNPNLKPTKVRGKFQPGDSMPSITLKGVNIRGQSTVEYEQAASAAQSEAESALNQDKVPRPYQQAVKDYFDDLK